MNYLEFNNIQFASGATTTFAHTPATSSGSPTANSRGIDFYGTLSGTIFGDITVKKIDGTLICTAVTPVGAWSCSGTPDWTTPSTGTSSQQFKAEAGGMTTAYTTVYWSDDHNPTFTTPSGVTKEYASSGTFTITWNSADVDGDLDEVYVDDLDGGYVYTTNADFYDLGISGTSDAFDTDWAYNAFLGTKTYTGRVYDGNLNYATTGTVSVTIQDTTDPVNTASPTDVTVAHEDGDTTTRNIGTWTATDLLAGTYDLDRVCYAWTGSKVENTRLTVRDNTAWSSGVATTTYNHAVNPYDSGCDWNGATGTQTDYTLWEYQITFSDTSSNTVSETWQYSKVYKNVNPNPNSPSNITFEVGLTGQTIAWTWTDNVDTNVDATWTIKKDTTFAGACGGTSVTSGTWSGNSGGKTYDASGETIDNYYCITVTDSAGQSATDVVFVDITTAQAPIINTPSDMNFEVHVANSEIIAWSWTDNYDNPTDTGDWNVRKHTIEGSACGGTIQSSGTWSSTVGNTNYDAGSESVDNYYCITVIDQAGNSATDIVFVDIVSAENPIFTLEPDATYTYENGNTVVRNIKWEFSDNFEGGTWETKTGVDTVACAGATPFDSGSWTGGTTGSSAIYDVGGKSSDMYYCITIYDEVGYGNSDYVEIDVPISASPSITFTPTDVNYEDGNEAIRNVHWTASDDFPDQYTIERKLDGGSYVEVRGLTSWTSTVDTADYDVGNLTIGVWTFKITFFEEDGVTERANALNSTDELVVTVIASEPPQITNTPSNTNYEDGNTLVRNVQWTATDSFPDTYIIEWQLNGGGWSTSTYGRTATAWASGVAIDIFGVGSLTAGTWEFNITFFEDTASANGLSSSHIITVIVATSEVPQITSFPSNINYEDGNVIDRWVDWTATDSYSATYIIEEQFNGGGWSTVRTATAWSNDNAVDVINIGSLSVGTWEYKITFSEDTASGTGKTSSHTVTITVATNEAPQITSSPSDIDYEDGNVIDRWVDWTATDSYPDTYIIEWQLNSGGWSTSTYGRTATVWVSGVATAGLNIGSLTVGTWEFRITFSEDTTSATGKTGSHTLTIIVATNEAPQITSTPSDDTYEDGDVSVRNIQWTATDSYSDIYIIEWQLNGGGWSTSTYGRTATAWVSGVAIAVFDIGGLTVGVWEFRITFSEDTASATGKTGSDTVVITVTTATAPIITAENDTSYVQGYTSYTISWNFTDEVEGFDWEIFQSLNNVTWNSIDSGSWSGLDGYASTVVTYDVDDLYYKINVTDIATNWAVDYIFVGVHPNVSISDFYYNEDYTNLEGYYPLDGDVLDYSGNDRDGTNNGVTFVNSEHGNAGDFVASEDDHITLPAFSLDGNKLTLSWWSNQEASGIQTIIGSDAQSSTIGYIWVYYQADDLVFQYAYGSGYTTIKDIDYLTAYSNQWIFTSITANYDTGLVNMYRNGILVHSQSMTTPIYPSTSRIRYIGQYADWTSYEHNGSIDEFRMYSDIKSEDYVNYMYNQYPSYHSNEKGWLQFTAFDKTEGTYEVYMNETLIGQGSWTNNSIYGHSLANGTLETGFYNLTLVVNDSTNVGVYSIMLYYYDVDPVIYISPNDQDMSCSESITLNWGVIDPYPSSYDIYRNGTIITTSSWTEGNYISTQISGLDANMYNYTLIVNDTIGNLSNDAVFVTVYDDILVPIFTSSPQNGDIASDSTDNYLVWTIDDDSDGTYIVYRNGSEWDTGNWYIDIPLYIDIDTTTIALLNFTIVITDEYSNEATDTVWIISRAVDSSDPVIYVTPDDISYSFGDTGNIINWAFADDFPDTYNITVDGEPLVINGIWDMSEYISLNVDGWSIGVYSVEITVYDTSGNSASDTMIVSVI